MEEKRAIGESFPQEEKLTQRQRPLEGAALIIVLGAAGPDGLPGQEEVIQVPPRALGICASSCVPGHLSICGAVITPRIRCRCCSKWIIANDLITYISTPWLPRVPSSTPPLPPASPLPSTLKESLQFIKLLTSQWRRRDPSGWGQY